ncbi:hypothetical protein, partial [Streptomyces sp. NPDC047315]|uniref:hypothetical protein n=1 Tax=Streptomyces sp. NPDC047315 TaxID=3155142 RepID=UPI0033D52A29
KSFISDFLRLISDSKFFISDSSYFSSYKKRVPKWRALKNLRFHKSEPFSDKNKALLVRF